MGGYLYLLLKSLVESENNKKNEAEHLPAFVFGDEGEFLGRVDVPVLAGSEKGN
ncbi:MAG TPA: hypothetical protein VFA83_19835 [Acidimicrobiales bacterium]|nr:hypothetical protein [Acidimicrobiales bacterium]